MRKIKQELKFDDLTKFSMPKKSFSCTKLKVKENGEIYVSPAIVESVRKNNEKMWADFRHSEDYKILMIKPGGEQVFRFPKAGIMKFKEWRDILQRLGYMTPAVYLFDWNEKEEIWIGMLQEVAEAPVL